MRTIMILVSVLAFSCGKGSSSGGDEAQESPVKPPVANPVAFSMAVPSEAELPACGEGNKYQLVYVKDAKAFKSCSGTAWEAVEISAPANAIKRSITCTGVLEGSVFSITYQAIEFENHDLFVMGDVRTPEHGVSSSTMYSPSQNGHATAAIAIGHDVAGGMNSGYWALTLDRETMVVTATYKDADVTGGEKSWTMPADKCVANTF